MRKTVFATLLALMILPASVMAQENRDENGKVKRGPYVTNGIFDNLFVEIGGGVNFYQGETGYKAKVGPQLDVNIGKWITPCVGIRVGYSGLKSSGISATPTFFSIEERNGGYYENFNYAYVHGDVMWNLNNVIGGYREDRVWSCIPYWHFGYLHSWYKGVAPRNFAMGPGLLNSFRVHPVVNVNLDFRPMVIRGSIHGNATPTCMFQLAAGVSYKFGKNTTTFRRACDVYADGMKAAQDAADAAVAAAKAAAEKDAAAKVAAMQKELDAAKGQYRVDTVYIEKAAAEHFTVLFPRSSRYANADQLSMLKKYVGEKIAQNPEQAFTVVGHADVTGKDKYNLRLSKARAEEVKKYMVETLGVKANKVDIKFVGASTKFSEVNPALNRAVLVVAE